jgi:hypothetical protein
MEGMSEKSQNSKTGKVAASPKPKSWQQLFDLLDGLDVPGDLLSDRGDEIPQQRPFPCR